MSELLVQYNTEKAWGLLSSIDIYDCDIAILQDAEAIKRYASELCEFIKMKAFGEPMVVHFGKGDVEGFSLVQLIETSLISGHFANSTNRAFIDIFSCQFYEPVAAAKFSKDYFRGSWYKLNYLIRK
ncbi:MAG: S-adenosylmethionine decarboxylase [Pseudomonadota bacterium]